MQQQLDALEDTALPHLSVALDGDKMLACFGKIIADSTDSHASCCVRECKIFRVKYRPGRHCLLGYLLSVEHKSDNSLHEYRLTARLYTPGKLHSHYCKAAMQEQAPSGVFPGIFCLEQFDMLVWSFPNDRKLHHLPVLLDADYIKSGVIPELLAARWGPDYRATNIQQSLVHYAPEHACTLRLQMEINQSATTVTDTWVVFGKTYYNDHGEQAFRNMQQLWSERRGRQQANISARPILYQPAIRTLWQEGLPGASLRGIAWMADSPQLLQHAANTLAALHDTRLDDLPRINITRLTERLQERSRCIAISCPALKATLEHVVRRLCLHAAACRSTASVTLHGDLHPQNLFADGERTSLIDLDQLKTGPAGIDLGSWMACCLYHASLKHQPLQAALQEARLFIDAYFQHRETWVSWREIAWFTAAALIDERLYRCLSRLKPGRLDIMPILLDWADRISRTALEGEIDAQFTEMSS